MFLNKLDLPNLHLIHIYGVNNNLKNDIIRNLRELYEYYYSDIVYVYKMRDINDTIKYIHEFQNNKILKLNEYKCDYYLQDLVCSKHSYNSLFVLFHDKKTKIEKNKYSNYFFINNTDMTIIYVSNEKNNNFKNHVNLEINTNNYTRITDTFMLE